MELIEFGAILLVLAAACSYLNYRFLGLPGPIGVMVLTLVVSMAALVAGVFFPEIERQAAGFVRQINFSRTVFHGMLGFLLFAGALQINFEDLAQQRMMIAVLATVAVVLSTVIVGGLAWCVLMLLGLPHNPIDCLLFGALISPTDPVAVLALLKRLAAPKSLEVTVAGESLFNDGVGVAIFVCLLDMAIGERGFAPAKFGLVFLREAGGGVAFGLAAGYVAYRLFKTVDDYNVEILLSLALAAGAYTLAERLNVSGPIAVVVAGLLIGNPGRMFAMSPKTVQNLYLFWDVIDQVLNAVLFVLLGLGVLAMRFPGRYVVPGVLMIPVVLLARLVSAGVPIALMRRWQRVERHAVLVLTWGGLRGALSVAMALSIPREIAGVEVPERHIILVATYVVVVFSILVQGLTIGPLTRRWLARDANEKPSA